ncbi:MAG TPA: type II secretion system F family protein [Planctomycetota bacterium]|nr:type II secretion system F family protein [Planctomycetota bacterium]
MASLLRAGLVVREAVAQVAEGGAFGALGARLAAEVGGGKALGEAMALFPDALPKEDVALVAAGETTGNIDRVLDRLADRHDARRTLWRRFVTSIGYPVLVFHLAALLTPLPSSLGKDGRLFGPTWFSAALAMLVPFYALVGAAFWMHRTARGREILRRIVNALPGFGSAARHRRRAQFADVLGAAYEAGVPIGRAVALARDTVGDPRLEAAVVAVGHGSTLRDALAGTGFLTPAILSRVAVGEQAGELSQVLLQTARSEAEAAEHTLHRTTAVLAKGIYIAIALWIAYYAISTLFGIYEPFLRD